MPYFDSAPSGDLMSSVKNAVAGLGGGGINPMQMIAVDQAAAKTAHELTLVGKLRGEIERQKKADELRSNPDAQAQFASDYAGTDKQTGRRIFGNLRGKDEPWSAADQEDADAAGTPLKTYKMAMPNVEAAIPRRIQDMLAALQAEQFGEGKSNAEQLIQGANRVAEGRVFGKAEDAAARGDVSQVNLNAAGVLGKKELTPFKTNEHGLTTNEWTGSAPDAPNALFANAVKEAEARTRQHAAQAANSYASAGLHKAQTGKLNSDAEINNDSSLPARAFLQTAGVKLSTLTPEARLAWIQNHAKGMDPLDNLVSLASGGGKRDALMQEARQVYETQYPKTLMGQRDPRAPNFLDFADQYVQLKEGGQRTPRPDAPGRNAQGRVRAAGEPQAQQVARPQSKADFDALPKGAVYIDPDDGKSYRKR